MRILALLALCACGEDYLRVDFEAEQYDFEDRPVAAGLVSRFTVTHVTMDFGDEDPTEDTFSADELTATVEGGQLVPCDNALCVIPDGDRLTVHVTTPAGDITESRRIVHALELARFNPMWGHSSDPRAHVLAAATSKLRLIVRERDGGEVSGHGATFAVTGDITFDGNEVVAGAPGLATIAIANTDIAPLQLKVIDPDASRASLDHFKVDRMFYDDKPEGLTTLDAYTEGSVGSYVFEGFDADGYVTLPHLAYDIVGGPGVEPHAPCATNEYCFLRGHIDHGTASSFVEVGTAKQRFPVTVIHGSY